MIICKCKLLFNDLTFNFKFTRMYNFNRYYSLRPYFITKIEYFMRQGHKFSHISEMNITFITMFNKMTFKSYLEQPEPMPEWKLIEKLAKNPLLMSEIDRTIYHPLTHAYGPLQDVI